MTSWFSSRSASWRRTGSEYPESAENWENLLGHRNLWDSLFSVIQLHPCSSGPQRRNALPWHISSAPGILVRAGSKYVAIKSTVIKGSFIPEDIRICRLRAELWEGKCNSTQIDAAQMTHIKSVSSLVLVIVDSLFSGCVTLCNLWKMS